MWNGHVTRTGEKKFLESFRDKMTSKAVTWGTQQNKGAGAVTVCICNLSEDVMDGFLVQNQAQ